MKKLIRAIIKIPATPFIVLGLVVGIFLYYVIDFFEWVYEASEFDREVTKSCQNELIVYLKGWFTTL